MLTGKFSNPLLTLSAALSCSLISCFAIAMPMGTASGGGGNEVVCFDDSKIVEQIKTPGSPNFQQISDEQIEHITSVEALDLYLAKMPRGFGSQAPSLVTTLSDVNERTFILLMADRFSLYFPWASEIMLNGSQNFPDDHIIMSQSGLSRVADENSSVYVSNPKCVVATVAFQHNIEKRVGSLEIDARIFNHPKQTQLSRNVLFMHEAIYSQTRARFGATDSASTRTLIAQLLKSSLTIGDVLKTWTDLSFYDSSINAGRLGFLSMPNRMNDMLGLVGASYDYIQEHPESDWSEAIRIYCPMEYRAVGCPESLKQATVTLLKKFNWNATSKKFELPRNIIGDSERRGFVQEPARWKRPLLDLQIPTL